MIHQIVAIKDTAIDAYLQPVFVRHLGAAIRSFIDEINNPESQISKHPGHFNLYHIGNYDDATGQFTNLVPGPLQISMGEQVVQHKGE